MIVFCNRVLLDLHSLLILFSYFHHSDRRLSFADNRFWIKSKLCPFKGQIFSITPFSGQNCTLELDNSVVSCQLSVVRCRWKKNHIKLKPLYGFNKIVVNLIWSRRCLWVLMVGVVVNLTFEILITPYILHTANHSLQTSTYATRPFPWFIHVQIVHVGCFSTFRH